MKYTIEDHKVAAILTTMVDLEKLLTERISDLHEVKGAMQGRHAYILYRNLLWEAKSTLQNNLTEVKENKK